jgi:hypothetical protein
VPAASLRALLVALPIGPPLGVLAAALVVLGWPALRR